MAKDLKEGPKQMLTATTKVATPLRHSRKVASQPSLPQKATLEWD